jgi:hypothetical protein
VLLYYVVLQATVASCIDAFVLIVTKSPKVRALLIFPICLDRRYSSWALGRFRVCKARELATPLASEIRVKGMKT